MTEIEAKLAQAEYYRDRYKMIADSASAMADYRMRRIMELEARVQELEGWADKVCDQLEKVLDCDYTPDCIDCHEPAGATSPHGRCRDCDITWLLKDS